MKINYNKKFNDLPNIIKSAASPVYMIYTDKSRIAVNTCPEIFDIFKSMCENVDGNIEMQLEFSDAKDMLKVVDYLVCA